MIKNSVETIKIPVSFLVDMKEVPEDVRKKLSELGMSGAPGVPVASPEMVAEVQALLPEKVLKQVTDLGAKLPTDIIELNMKFGDFIFNLYAFNVKPVQAPLAIKRHEKKLLELSEICSLDEFNVPADVKAVIEPILMDEKKWKDSQFSAYVTVVDEKGVENPRYIGLTSMGASFFMKTLDAAVAVLDETPPKDEKK